MFSNLLYRAFGFRQYQCVRTTTEDGVILFHLEQDAKHDRCSHCQSPDVIRHGPKNAPFAPCQSAVNPSRSGCPCLGSMSQLRPHPSGGDRLRQAPPPLLARLRTLCPQTVIAHHAFERYALKLLSHMTIQAVADHLQVGWDTIKDLFKRYLKIHFAEPKLKTFKRLAIDEISIGHGHRYLTVVLDLQSGAVVFIGKGKGADALIPFWKRLKASYAKIEAIATDMSPAYTMAICENLPKALHVFDHFHIVKLFNDRLSDFRRELFREAEGPLGKKILKGTRWLILKNPENLDETKGERARLEEALRINQPLATAYYMKEEFRHFWDQENVEAATRFLDDWCLRAEASMLSVLKKMASTFRMHRTGLLNYHRCPISTGPLEGLNNKIKTLQRQAYGYRDQEFFELRIYAIHKAEYALVG